MTHKITHTIQQIHTYNCSNAVLIQYNINQTFNFSISISHNSVVFYCVQIEEKILWLRMNNKSKVIVFHWKNVHTVKKSDFAFFYREKQNWKLRTLKKKKTIFFRFLKFSLALYFPRRFKNWKIYWNSCFQRKQKHCPADWFERKFKNSKIKNWKPWNYGVRRQLFTD